MVAKKKTYKIDLFPMLSNISTKNVGYYDTLSEENLKEFAPIVFLRWLSGCKGDARQIFFLNEMVNPYVFHLHKHKRLLFNLMTASTSGKAHRYQYIKTKPKLSSTTPLAVQIVVEIFDYSKKEAQEAINILTDADIIDLAEQLGRQDAEIKAIKKELKTKRKR